MHAWQKSVVYQQKHCKRLQYQLVLETFPETFTVKLSRSYQERQELLTAKACAEACNVRREVLY